MDLFSQIAEITKPAPSEEIPAAPILSHHYKLAERAYNGTSFSPERRAQSNIKEFSDMLTADLLQVPDNYKVKYQKKFEGFYTGWLQSKSRCMSSMITGPANFPVARMQKYNQWEDNKFNDFMQWRKRIISALARSERKRTQGSELEQAVKNLNERKAAHERMKAANKIINKPNAAELLAAQGFNEETIANLLNPKYSYDKKGFQGFYLTNNNANIKRLEDRVKQLQAKEQVKEQIAAGEKTTPEITINGAVIRQDFTIDRICIIFDGKPEANVIAALKSSGFHWSPHHKVWMRKNTSNAVYAAKHICTNELKPVEDACK